MTTPADFTDEDRLLLVDYIHGRLDASNSASLEQRIADDPRLGAAFDELIDTESAVRDALAGHRTPSETGRIAARRLPTDFRGSQIRGTSMFGRQPRRNFVIYVSLAASLVIALGIVLIYKRAPVVEVALLRSATQIRDYGANLGLDPGLLPIGNQSAGSLRGPEETVPPIGHPAVDALAPREYEQRVHQAQRTILEAALDRLLPAPDDKASRSRIEASFGTADKPLQANYYHVAVRTTRESSLVILAVQSDGVVARLFPGPDATLTASERFGPGTHVLPANPVSVSPRSEQDNSVEWNSGYLLPRFVSRALVLTAARSERIEPALYADLELASRTVAEAHAGGPGQLKAMSDDLAHWLRARGFTVETVEIREQSAKK